MDWKDVVSKLAPLLGTALGGPLGGMAAATVSQALLGRQDAGEDELAAAVAGAGPEQLAALKQAEQDFKARMAELGLKAEDIAAQDRASARQRETTLKDWTPRLLALAITVGFFGLLGTMLGHDIPEGNRQVLDIMIGALGTAWTGVVTYYFGSSAGSARKTEMLGHKP